MPFTLDPSRPVAEELRRVASEQVARAVGEIEDADLGSHETVHQVRKRCKKLRGLVRLVRPSFEAYQDENAEFRDTARTLSGLRDLEADLEAWDLLMERFGAGLDEGLRDRTREALLERRRQGAEGPIDDRLAAAAVRLRRARDRIDDWELAASRFAALGDGLQKTYRRGRNRLAEAEETPDGELLHEWRKRVKYGWYHLRLLDEAWPGPLQARADEAKRLSDLLGDHHDLENLDRALEECLPRSGHRLLRALTARYRRDLRSHAIRLGRRLYLEKPGPFRRRLGGYWPG